MRTRLRQLLTVTVGILSCFAATNSMAAGAWSGKVTIQNLTMRADGTVLITNKTGSWKNRDLCDGDTQIVMLSPDAENSVFAYREIYTAMLGAHLSKRKVNIYLRGCKKIGTKTFPVVDRITVS
jgi:hypothetical protein